jgi:hypothetical protein
MLLTSRSLDIASELFTLHLSGLDYCLFVDKRLGGPWNRRIK